MSRRFLADTTVSLAAAAGASVLSYVQLVACGRILDKPAFGRLGSLLALLALSTVFGNLVVLQVTRAVAAAGPAFDSRRYVGRVLVAAIGRGWPLLVGALLVSPLVARALHVGLAEVLAMLAALGALLAGCLGQGITAGLRRLRLQAALAFGGSAVKLTSTLLLLAVAPGVVTALAGSSLGYLFVLLGTVAAVAACPDGSRVEQAKAPLGGGMDARLGLAYFLSFAPFMVDQLLVQAVAPGLAGDYTALATLGKTMFQAVTPVLTVVYAYLVANRHRPRAQEQYFRLGSALLLAVSLAGASLMALYPSQVVATLFSPRYAGVAPYLPAYAFGVVAYAFGHGVVLLFVARNDNRILLPQAVAFALQVALLLLCHDSLGALTAAQVVSYSSMALLPLLWLAAVRRRPRVPASLEVPV